jgi:integrase
VWRHRERWKSLGPADLISIREAREKTFALRKAVHDGRDPFQMLASRPAAATGKSFADALHAYLKIKMTRWATSNREREHRDHMRTFALIPEFTALPIKAIDPAAKADALAKLGKSGRRKATSWIKAIIAFAETGEMVERGRVDDVEHHSAMPVAQVPAFYAGIAKLDSDDARALRFTILTGARTDEIIGAKHKAPATWKEIVGDVWDIPGERMKGGKRHRVPLTQAMVAILGKRRADDVPLFKVSNSRRMLDCLKANGGENYTVHGFRTSVSAFIVPTWGADLADMYISHLTSNKVRRAYQRDDLLERRREIAVAWSDYVTSRLG